MLNEEQLSSIKTVRFSEHENDKLLSSGSDNSTSKHKYENMTMPGASSKPSGSNPAEHLSNIDSNSSKSNQKITEENKSNMKETKWKRKVLKVVVTIMFLIMAIGVIVIWALHEGGGEILKEDGYFVFDIEEYEFSIELKRRQSIFKLKLGGKLFKDLDIRKCKDSSDKYCYQTPDGMILRLNDFKVNQVQCYSVTWQNITENFIPQDCFNLNFGQWYGMMNTESPSQNTWPIKNMQIQKQVVHPGNNKDIGNFYNFYWLSSTGTSFYVPDDSPIQISFNETDSNKFCISPPFLKDINQETLRYTFCQGQTVKEVHLSTSSEFNFQPLSLNESDLSWTLDYIWGTENLQSSNINEFIYLRQAVTSHNFSCKIIGIPVTWEENIGNFDVSKAEMQTVLQTMGSSGCSLMYSVFPLCSFESHNFLNGMRKNEFIKSSATEATHLLKYKNTQCAVWNMFDADVETKITDMLQKLVSKYSIHMLELKKMPPLEILDRSSSGGGELRLLYSKWLQILKNLTGIPIVEETFRTHNTLSAVEVVFKTDNISQTNCLSNSIPNALTLGLFGYSLQIASFESISLNPDSELMIRWLQIAAFFPAIKTPLMLLNNSAFPAYAEEILTLHKSVYANGHVKESLYSKMEPIIQPMWWFSPEDAVSYGISDQFIVADTFLVAPVFCSGSRERDIYLPAVSENHVWLYRNNRSTHIYQAGKWLRNFPVSLYEIAFFQKKKASTPSF